MRTPRCFLLLGAVSLMHFSAFAQDWANGGNSLSANGSLGTNTNFALIFKTNNSERGRLTNGGNWGIGTTSPITKFHVNGFGAFGNSITATNATRALNLADVNAVMRVLRVHATDAPAVELISRTTADGANVAYWDFYVEPSDKSFRIRDRIGTVGQNRVVVKNNGFVGIGTTTPSQHLHVVGNGTVTGNLGIGITSPTQKLHVVGNGILTGSLGIGITAPGFPFEVNGRIRLHNGIGGSAGLWLNNTSNSAAIAFIGVLDDNNIGFWGNTGAGWGFTMNTTSGDVTVRGDGRAYLFNEGQYFRDGVGVTDDIEVHGDLVPDNDGFHNLGSDALTWSSVWAVDATINTSDARFKKNIENSPYGLKEIMKLRPVIYNWINHPDETKRIGLIAQEVQKVIPEMVKDTRFTRDHNTGKFTKIATVRLGLQYDALIPILTSAIQEQQHQIEQQQEQLDQQQLQINELKDLVKRLANGQSIATDIDLNGNSGQPSSAQGSLEQNSPNPVRGTTLIRYRVPEGTSTARLTLINSVGQELKSVALTNRGTGQVNLNIAGLAAGIYHYSLWVDGRKIATKQLVVAQ